jgi:protease I
VSDGFEQSEFDEPVSALRQLGARVDVLGQNMEQLTKGISALDGLSPGRHIRPDQLVNLVSPEDYDALLIPGGAISVDFMRCSRMHLGFARSFFAAGKPVGAICHAPWLLADAGVLRGRTLTSWPAIQKDLERAGAIWKDCSVHEDGNLITCRGTEGMSAFIRAFVRALDWGQHPSQAA